MTAVVKHGRLLLLILTASMFLSACGGIPENYFEEDDLLSIYPDYTDVIIPPNIAPLNFRIQNDGEKFIVEFSNDENNRIRIQDHAGKIIIPVKKWKKMLEEGRGGALTIKVYQKNNDGKWSKYTPVINQISDDEIDPYVAYRKIPPSYMIWYDMGIYQRCVENFEVSPIMENSLADRACMNCHSFNARNPDQFMLHFRAFHNGTIIKDKEELKFINTKSDHTRSAGVYPSWHPDGRLIAYSTNKINQTFHAKKGKMVYVFDKFSDIVLYDIENNIIIRPEQLSSDQLENTPVWSEDGTKLYYICSDKFVDTADVTQKYYNLMAIPFDVSSREFGEPDTLINASINKSSVSFPREAPGKDILSFVAADYGYFTVYNSEADVYFYNTQSQEITKPELNSEFTESYPSWSQNGSWLMFISKRNDEILSHVWFSHIDESGKAGKPFVLPQKDPDFYAEYLYNFNRPEFVSGKIDLNPRKILSVIKRDPIPSGFDEENSVSLSSGATKLVGVESDVFYNRE